MRTDIAQNTVTAELLDVMCENMDMLSVLESIERNFITHKTSKSIMYENSLTYESDTRTFLQKFISVLQDIWRNICRIVRMIIDKLFPSFTEDESFISRYNAEIIIGIEKGIRNNTRVQTSLIFEYDTLSKLQTLTSDTERLCTLIDTFSDKVFSSIQDMRSEIDDSYMRYTVNGVYVFEKGQDSLYNRLMKSVFSYKSPIFNKGTKNCTFQEIGITDYKTIVELFDKRDVRKWEKINKQILYNSQKIIDNLDKLSVDKSTEEFEKALSHLKMFAISSKNIISSIFAVYTSARNVASTVMKKAYELGKQNIYWERRG